MSVLGRLFCPFFADIQRVYASACKDAAVDATMIPLRLEDLSDAQAAYEAEFAAFGAPAPFVRITWNGIASLWAFSQAVIRIGRPCFEAQRAADPHGAPPEIPVTGDVETGIDLVTLSVRLAKNRFDRWVEWAPVPDAQIRSDPDGSGNFLFLNALSWIVRHELAHIVLNHHAVTYTLPDDKKRAELEADAKATLWMKGLFAPSISRSAGSQPSSAEIALERRALGVMCGLLWLTQFELISHGTSPTHPDAVSRLTSVISILQLREDSFASEILCYIVKVLIDPESPWPSDAREPSASDAAIDALIRLNRFITDQRQ
ncbi:hypothetical protein STVA_28210 [Allostella vacuolata]|nr:hypothetical protein STVA_28210 [Stella vacuolata]